MMMMMMTMMMMTMMMMRRMMMMMMMIVLFFDARAGRAGLAGGLAECVRAVHQLAEARTTIAAGVSEEEEAAELATLQARTRPGQRARTSLCFMPTVCFLCIACFITHTAGVERPECDLLARVEHGVQTQLAESARAQLQAFLAAEHETLSGPSADQHVRQQWCAVRS
eukprot:SAG25_NODE_999_length_4354_cov_5.464160_2_plen_168_part_00